MKKKYMVIELYVIMGVLCPERLSVWNKTFATEEIARQKILKERDKLISQYDHIAKPYEYRQNKDNSFILSFDEEDFAVIWYIREEN